MHFVSRDFVCERLSVGLWQSYRMVRASRLSLVSTDDVIGLLNRSRVACPEVDFIPSDICTAEEVERRTGVPARKLKAWTRRRVNRPPHYRINKQVTRFSLSSVEAWLERNSKRRRRA